MGGDDRERRAALLDWDGDYSQFQRDEVKNKNKIRTKYDKSDKNKQK